MEYFQGVDMRIRESYSVIEIFLDYEARKRAPNDRLAEIRVGNTDAPPIDGSAEMMIIKISWLDHRKM